MMNVLSSILNNMDVIVFIILCLIHLLAWREFKGKAAKGTDLQKRNMGAQFMTSSSTAGITAVSILIPACFIIVQLGFSGDKLPAPALDNIFRASIWFLISIILGLYLLWLIPMRMATSDVSAKFETGIPFGFQLLSLLMGIGRLVAATYLTIYG